MDMADGGRRFDRWRRQGRLTRSSLAAVTAVLLALSSGCSTPPTSAGHPSTVPSPTATASTVALPATVPATSRTVVTALPSHRTSTSPAATKVIVPAPTSAAPPVQSAPAASCHPLTNGGNCYEPGEFCRKTDHGSTGVAGDGKPIVCINNNGWRWEPV
jgi:hypothetical protein